MLENMRLKSCVLDSLLLPLALKHGLVGRLEIRIPLARLTSEPIVVVLDRVFAVVEPKYQWDEVGKAERDKAVKNSKVSSWQLACPKLRAAVASSTATLTRLRRRCWSSKNLRAGEWYSRAARNSK